MNGPRLAWVAFIAAAVLAVWLTVLLIATYL